MAEIVLKPELIKGLQKVLVDYDKANEDPVLAAQYLSAVVGSIVATSGIPKDAQKEILDQLIDFIRYVYDQQTKAVDDTSNKNTAESQEAFGKWEPK